MKTIPEKFIRHRLPFHGNLNINKNFLRKRELKAQKRPRQEGYIGHCCHALHAVVFPHAKCAVISLRALRNRRLSRAAIIQDDRSDRQFLTAAFITALFAVDKRREHALTLITLINLHRSTTNLVMVVHRTCSVAAMRICGSFKSICFSCRKKSSCGRSKKNNTSGPNQKIIRDLLGELEPLFNTILQATAVTYVCRDTSPSR